MSEVVQHSASVEELDASTMDSLGQALAGVTVHQTTHTNSTAFLGGNKSNNKASSESTVDTSSTDDVAVAGWGTFATTDPSNNNSVGTTGTAGGTATRCSPNEANNNSSNNLPLFLGSAASSNSNHSVSSQPQQPQSLLPTDHAMFGNSNSSSSLHGSGSRHGSSNHLLMNEHHHMQIQQNSRMPDVAAAKSYYNKQSSSNTSSAGNATTITAHHHHHSTNNSNRSGSPVGTGTTTSSRSCSPYAAATVGSDTSGSANPTTLRHVIQAYNNATSGPLHGHGSTANLSDAGSSTHATNNSSSGTTTNHNMTCSHTNSAPSTRAPSRSSSFGILDNNAALAEESSSNNNNRNQYSNNSTASATTAPGGGQVLYMAVPSPDGRGQVLQPVQMVQMPGGGQVFQPVVVMNNNNNSTTNNNNAAAPPPLPPSSGNSSNHSGGGNTELRVGGDHQHNNNNNNVYHQNHDSSAQRNGDDDSMYAPRNANILPSSTSAAASAASLGGGPFDPAVSSLYALPNQTRPSLDDLLGQIRRLSRDQVGCRLVQQALDEEGPMAATLILNEGLSFWGESMVDPFGNYLFQKILEKVTLEERIMLVKSVSPRLVNASLNLHGTRSVQKVVELCAQDFAVQQQQGNTDVTAADILTQALQPAAARLCIDSHGNHVIQRILLKLDGLHRQFVFDAVAASVGDIARHRHGCCVIQRCLDVTVGKDRIKSNDHQNNTDASMAANARHFLVTRIIEKALELMQDAYGNYVVQYVLDVCSVADVQAVCQAVVGKVHLLAIQKFSSNVMEKCLERCSDSIKEAYINEIIGDDHTNDSLRVRELMMDPFGNYVVQRALSVASHTQAVRLVEAMRPHLQQQQQQAGDPLATTNTGSVRNTAGGRRIIAKICRRFPNFTLGNTGGAPTNAAANNNMVPHDEYGSAPRSMVGQQQPPNSYAAAYSQQQQHPQQHRSYNRNNNNNNNRYGQQQQQHRHQHHTNYHHNNNNNNNNDFRHNGSAYGGFSDSNNGYSNSVGGYAAGNAVNTNNNAMNNGYNVNGSINDVGIGGYGGTATANNPLIGGGYGGLSDFAGGAVGGGFYGSGVLGNNYGNAAALPLPIQQPIAAANNAGASSSTTTSPQQQQLLSESFYSGTPTYDNFLGNGYNM